MRTALLRLAVLAACAALPMAVLAQVAVPIPVSQGEATSVLASPDGAVTLAGFVFSDGDFDPGPGEALGRGGFIARYESDGALRWLWAEGTGTRDAQIFGATNRPEDGIAAAAWLNGTLDLDPGPGETTVSGSQGLLVLALDAAGALDWSIVVDGSARIFAQGIGTDASGNVYVTGWIQQGSADFDPGPGVTQLSSSGFDLFVASYSASGAFRWAFNVGSSGTAQVRGYALAVDATGVLVGGQFVNTHDFDPGPGEAELSSRGGADGFVARYALDGTFEWATQFGDTGTDITLGLGATGDGGALVAGQVETDARNNERAAYMARLLPNGTAAWAHTIPGGRGDQVQARAAAVVGDQAVFGGRYGADFDADAGPGERILLLPAGGGLGATGYLASYDVGTGGLVEAARIGEVTPAVVSAVAAGTQPDAPVLIGGGFSDRVTFPDSQSLTVSPASLQPLYAAGFVFGPRPPLSLTVEEQIGVTDEVSILRALALLVEEQIGVTDAVSLLEALQLLVEEQIGVTDDVSFLEALTLLIEERIGITDEAIVLRALALLIEERIGVTDEASLLQAIRLLVQEQIGVTDDADLLRALQLLVEERIGTTDGAGLDSDAFAFASLFTGVDGRFTFGETGMTLDLVGEGMGEITVLRLYD
ncbi:MAG: SBBP repeat-containing protein, partial [Bacteroidota bacterium]